MTISLPTTADSFIEKDQTIDLGKYPMSAQILSDVDYTHNTATINGMKVNLKIIGLSLVAIPANKGSNEFTYWIEDATLAKYQKNSYADSIKLKRKEKQLKKEQQLEKIKEILISYNEFPERNEYGKKSKFYEQMSKKYGMSVSSVKKCVIGETFPELDHYRKKFKIHDDFSTFM